MSAYTSFITEFGLVGFIAFLAATLRFIARGMAKPFEPSGTAISAADHCPYQIDEYTIADLDAPRPWTKLTVC